MELLSTLFQAKLLDWETADSYDTKEYVAFMVYLM